MKRLILTACLCLIIFSVVEADPIEITSGLGYNLDRTSSSSFQFSFQNADGSLSTNIQTGNIVSPMFNSALPGQPLSLLLRGSGNDVFGTFIYNGRLWYSFSSIEILASALAPTDMLPGVPVHVFAPFTFTGVLFGQDTPNPAIPPNATIAIPVFGTGVVDATVVFGGQSYFATNVVYHFGVTEVPEPATILLLGTGLAGVAAKVGRRRRAREE